MDKQRLDVYKRQKLTPVSGTDLTLKEILEAN